MTTPAEVIAGCARLTQRPPLHWIPGPLQDLHPDQVRRVVLADLALLKTEGMLRVPMEGRSWST